MTSFTNLMFTPFLLFLAIARVRSHGMLVMISADTVACPME